LSSSVFISSLVGRSLIDEACHNEVSSDLLVRSDHVLDKNGEEFAWSDPTTRTLSPKPPSPIRPPDKNGSTFSRSGSC
jgi:hypothetical protein